MDDTVLKEKIDGLPEYLKEQVSDFVDFLLHRYSDSQPALTEEEKTELDNRWATHQQGASPTSSLEEVEERLKKKHGISN